jgi:hypothetical protein
LLLEFLWIAFICISIFLIIFRFLCHLIFVNFIILIMFYEGFSL